ncbi:MAG TPA: FtsQ-type POTRA domain-containing protein [Gaiella sp.]|nr:FtsQ-type POTRA domain-containing protein [Gaiella sp.]
MATRGRAGRERPPARTASVVVPFPRRDPGDPLELGRLVPSGRALLIAFGVLAGVLVALLLARETSLFGVSSIEVTGAGPGVAGQVERALSDRKGNSLVGLDLDAARADVLELSTVAGVSFDRAFPHTLRVTVDPERPVAVARQGAASYVLSDRGRVMARVDRHDKPRLARMWVAKDVTLEKGAIVDGDLRVAVEAVTPLAGAHFPGRVVSLTTENEQLMLRLQSGLELRLGDIRDVDLKLAVAARVIPQLPIGAGYLDVSVPDRPVAGPPGSDPQVEAEGSTSSTP